MLSIPVVYLKDKQAFQKRILSQPAKPIDMVKDLAKEYKLIHIVDLDALAGRSTNLDIYDKLTYFVNVEVESAPIDVLVKKLLSLKCRVVIRPLSSNPDLSEIREKKLLVALVKSDDKSLTLIEQFHDVIVENADEDSVKRFTASGKRVIIYEKDRKSVQSEVWGVLISV